MNRSRSLPFRSLRAVLALGAALMTLAGNRPAAADTTEAIVDTVQHTAVMYFWEQANPANGLVRDRSTLGSPCSIAATGFGLSALCIGVDHGWIDRDAARARTLTTLQTFWNGPQGTAASGTIGYQGFYYHFLDMNTAVRTWDSELSSIDSALLFAGILDAKMYWTGPHPDEAQIRALADSIYYRANWTFFRNFSPGLYMGWKPGTGFANFGIWYGYNEAMILYLLALGSPTHPVPTAQWNTWTSHYTRATYYGYTFVTCPPLFTHQYSHCWVDFRNTQDLYMRQVGSTYFENSRFATLAQREYCIANPVPWGYTGTLWGLTASDDPFGYAAHGAPPAQSDNGTITPTAGLSSIVFAPEVVIPLMQNLWDNWRATTWGPYGFKDAFNPYWNWVDTDYLGIDQGPIAIMFENYRRDGAVWNRMFDNEDLRRGLQRADFQPIITGVGEGVAAGVSLSPVAPNPVEAAGTVRFTLARAGRVTLAAFDLRGRLVRTVFAGERPAGAQSVPLDATDLAPGVYHLRLATTDGAATTRFVRVP